MFSCIELGSRQNPCHVKVIGPTLGAVLGIVVAVVTWPVGALVYCFNRPAGRSVMSAPASTYVGVSRPIPI